MSRKLDHCAHVAEFFIHKASWWASNIPYEAHHVGIRQLQDFLNSANACLRKAIVFSRRSGMHLEGGAA